MEEEEEGSQDPEVPIETKPSDQSNESGESHDQGVESISFIVVQISSNFIVFFLESTNQSAAVSEFASGEVFNAATRHKHSSTPYGLPCVRELVRFLISIINVRDRWVGHKYIYPPPSSLLPPPPSSSPLPLSLLLPLSLSPSSSFPPSSSTLQTQL